MREVADAAVAANAKHRAEADAWARDREGMHTKLAAMSARLKTAEAVQVRVNRAVPPPVHRWQHVGMPHMGCPGARLGQQRAAQVDVLQRQLSALRKVRAAVAFQHAVLVHTGSMPQELDAVKAQRTAGATTSTAAGRKRRRSAVTPSSSAADALGTTMAAASSSVAHAAAPQSTAPQSRPAAAAAGRRPPRVLRQASKRVAAAARDGGGDSESSTSPDLSVEWHEG